MKLSSIVSLILGAIAIIVGMIICSSAENQALASGYNLHQPIYDENGNIEKEYSFSIEDDVNVSKVSIELDGANVYVIGGAEKSKIVVRNMFAGTYSCNVSNKVITVTNNIDVSNLLDAAKDLEFNGIRQLFNFDNFKKRQPEVYVYLNYSSEQIKQLSLEVTNCVVSVQNIEGSLDLRLDAENSTLSFTDFITDSSIDCELIDSDVSFTNVNFLKASVKGEKSNFTFDSDLVVLYSISAKTAGTIKANGTEHRDTFKHNENQPDYPSINIELKSGNVVLNYVG